MITEFDILFDNICADVFPKVTAHIQDNCTSLVEGYVDSHCVIKFLENIEGFDSDMSMRIWDSYQINNQAVIQDLLNRSAEASVLSTSTKIDVSADKRG
tara:strand:+ start:776 stop:1072 length:297 start_codon:yes stop_codon:yes gene_type:complete